jgi:MoxR-like ATPase
LAFTDSVASASHRLNNGEVIKPAHGFSVVMTTNLEDPNDLHEALRDRFPVAICMDAPHPAALMSLPEDLRAIAAKVVAAPKGRRASLRAFYEFQKLRRVFNLLQSAEIAFGKNLAESIVDALEVSAL